MISMIFLVISTILYFIFKTLEEKDQALKEINDSLEMKVKIKTEELLILNENLQHEIEIQVNDLKEKNDYIISQARFSAMGEMIASIAHQWRQPLNSLALVQQKMQLFYERGQLDDKNFNANVKKSMTLINAMSTTIDDFRNFFNPNKEKVAFSINETIVKAISMIKPILDKESITCNEMTSDDNLLVYGYQNELSQVIINILNNAKDALLANNINNPRIKIDVAKDGDDVLITFADNGGGIPHSLMSKIFEPYFTTKEKSNGTGIGLYMSKIIIKDNMNGTLEASNKDDGACFCITIPSA